VSQTASKQHIIGILPARWGSIRFPGKPLHLIAGKPLIQHVWERCQSATLLSEILVATDDARIAEAVTFFGGKAIMTSPDHPTGTDRLAEVAKQVPEATHIINIQGDEPLIDPALIDALAKALIDDPDLHMVTAANPLDPSDPAVADPNVVKTVLKQNGKCCATRVSTDTAATFSKPSSPGRPHPSNRPNPSNSSAPSRTEPTSGS
jgi:3-deoxy-manno-octulosonate cytidylyltransferase (CMP-KDO synthetase)